MQITRRFPRVLFQPAAIREGYRVLAEIVSANPILSEKSVGIKSPLKLRLSNLLVERGRDTIEHEDEEQFFADYRKVPDRATYTKHIGSCSLHIHYHNLGSSVCVNCPSQAAIDAVLNSFEEAAPMNRLPDPKPIPKPSPSPPVSPKIFIGHGHTGLWRELKDHLTDKHGFDVVAYEVGARAGHTIRDILDDMLTKSSMAFFVLTGENCDAAGLMHARENVIRETGLFQGRLGFARSIVVLEEGTVEFSNIHGIANFGSQKGNIKEVFGDVVAVIRREFGQPV